MDVTADPASFLFWSNVQMVIGICAAVVLSVSAVVVALALGGIMKAHERNASLDTLAQRLPGSGAGLRGRVAP